MVNAHTVRIEPVKGGRLPPGLLPGDILKLQDQSPVVRLAFATSIVGTTGRAGAPLKLVIDRHGSRVTISTTFYRVQDHVAQIWLSSLLRTFTVLLMAIALITLWGGRDWGAWGISLWSIAFLAGLLLRNAPVAGWGLYATMIAAMCMLLAARIGFYVMAETIVGPALTPQLRRTLRLLFVLCLLPGFAFETGYPLLLVFAGRLVSRNIATVWMLPYLFATAMILLGYRYADAARRPRLRWMFWSALILTIAILVADVNLPALGAVNSGIVSICGFVVAVSGLLYAVLRHRVVDMAFVVNRAVVYSMTIAFVAALFIILEVIVEEAALPTRTGVLLQIVVALRVGFSLGSIRKRIEGLSERLFFRRKFKSEAALRAFGLRCLYIEDAEHLIEQTLAELERYSEAPAVAFYWREAATYRRIGAKGAPLYPEALDPDDPAVVSLRADRQEADLAALHGSALGADGLLLPMIVRGELLGTVVCAHRPGESYPSDERDLLVHVVHEVGAALHTLHSRDSAQLVDELAAGVLTPAAAMERARALANPA